MDRLFRGAMYRSDRLRRALLAAAGEQATGTQREQAQAGGGFRHGGGAAAACGGAEFRVRVVRIGDTGRGGGAHGVEDQAVHGDSLLPGMNRNSCDIQPSRRRTAAADIRVTETHRGQAPRGS